MIAERQNDIIKTLAGHRLAGLRPDPDRRLLRSELRTRFRRGLLDADVLDGLILMSTLVQLALFAGVAGSERCEPEGFEPDLYVGCLAAG